MRMGAEQFNPDALVEARESRMLTMTVLSEMTGISRQSLYTYEHGEIAPTPETLERISRAVGLPFDFFLKKEPSEKKLSKPHYRALKSRKKSFCRRAEIKLKWLSRIFEFYSKYIEFPEVDIPAFDIANPQLLTSSEIEDLAQELRLRWQLGRGPITNITWVLENHGIIVSSDDLIDNALDALSGWHEGLNRPFMLLNGNKGTCVRFRFDLSHELGHLVLHRNINYSAFEEDQSYFNMIEEQAHRFAAAFLIPERSMRDEVMFVDLATLKNMKVRWKASIAMLIRRACDVGLIGMDERNRLIRTVSARGWRTREPFDDIFKPEQPVLLRECFQALVEQQVLSKHDVLHGISLSPQDLQVLNGLDEDELVDEKPSIKIIDMVNGASAPEDDA